MNYIQETASSSLCLGTKRNKEGLDKRSYITTLKEYGLDLEYVWWQQSATEF